MIKSFQEHFVLPNNIVVYHLNSNFVTRKWNSAITRNIAGLAYHFKDFLVKVKRAICKDQELKQSEP